MRGAALGGFGSLACKAERKRENSSRFSELDSTIVNALYARKSIPEE
jgi:hypothetical protein